MHQALDLFSCGQKIGKITSLAWSFQWKINIAIAMINTAYQKNEHAIEVQTPLGKIAVQICDFPFSNPY